LEERFFLLNGLIVEESGVAASQKNKETGGIMEKPLTNEEQDVEAAERAAYVVAQANRAVRDAAAVQDAAEEAAEQAKRAAQDAAELVAWVKAAQDAAQRAREAAERAMAVERAAAGRVIAMGQVADVVRIGEEAAYAEARAASDEAQAAWDAATSWAMYAVVRNANQRAWVVVRKAQDAEVVMRKAQDAEVRVSARCMRKEAEAAYAVAQREVKAVWGKADRTWAAWEAVVRKNK
jgi:hypothetical protein